ncbi:MAG TPA: GGDEF domain-containing protein [Minicystis sp.]|nr:GGDEF domain-containing protein [Minicystis sp.]
MASRSRRAVRYPVAGVLLAVGAPIGHVLLRAALAGTAPTPAFVAHELRDLGATSAYLTASTALVFGWLGAVLGRREDALEALAATDALTDLANRRQAFARLSQEIARAQRLDAPVSLLAIDVDGLKQINDAGGHAAGDAAIRAVADAMRASCRATDVLARVGGDEFLVIAGGTALEEATAVAERIRAALAGRSVRVSVGVASAPGAAASADDLVRRADEAVYEAKHAGRDRVVRSTRPPA